MKHTFNSEVIMTGPHNVKGLFEGQNLVLRLKLLLDEDKGSAWAFICDG